MPPPKNPHQIQVFNGVAQFYRCFIKHFAIIMALITKLIKKTKTFFWIKECQKAWELIKQKHIETPMLISPNQQVEFHVHTNASLLIVRTMLSQNLTRKSDQSVVYASRVLNIVQQKQNTIEREALAMVFALHKFKRDLLGNKFVFYVNHMALVYMVNNHMFQGEQLGGCYCS